jgi:hypothetical protein
VALDIDKSVERKQLCSILSLIAKNSEDYKTRVKARNQARIYDDTPIYQIGATPELTCYNNLSYPGYEYAPVSIVHYWDSGKLWCFSSDRYKELLSSGRNPYNGNRLPRTVMGELLEKSSILERSDLRGLAPLNVFRTIDSLSHNDVIVDEESQRIIRNFKELVSSYNGDKQIVENISLPDIRRVLDNLDLTSEKDLSGLSTDRLTTHHARVTFFRLLTRYIKEQEKSPDLSKTVSKIIKML